jgi:fructose-specific phosphotransferase system IIC component
MSTERALLRGAVIPTFVVGLISIALSTWLKGSAGLVGALLAQFVVVIFFAANIGAARLSRDLDPVMAMSIAMFSYMAKVLLLGVFLWLITTFVSADTCDRKAFALSAVAATFAWLGGEIKAYLGLKLHLQLPPKQ